MLEKAFPVSSGELSRGYPSFPIQQGVLGAIRGGEKGWSYLRCPAGTAVQRLAKATTAAETGFFDGALPAVDCPALAPQGASTGLIAADLPILIDSAGVFNGYRAI
jgi:hypothetical protein